MVATSVSVTSGWLQCVTREALMHQRKVIRRRNVVEFRFNV